MLSNTISYDLIAKISLLPTQLGGRQSPVFTGYRPSFSFNTIQYYCGEIQLIQKDILKPGDSANAVIKLLPARTLRRDLKPNDAFVISEGTRAIGSGIIQEVKIID